MVRHRATVLLKVSKRRSSSRPSCDSTRPGPAKGRFSNRLITLPDVIEKEEHLRFATPEQPLELGLQCYMCASHGTRRVVHAIDRQAVHTDRTPRAPRSLEPIHLIRFGCGRTNYGCLVVRLYKRIRQRRTRFMVPPRTFDALLRSRMRRGRERGMTRPREKKARRSDGLTPTATV